MAGGRGQSQSLPPVRRGQRGVGIKATVLDGDAEGGDAPGESMFLGGASWPRLWGLELEDRGAAQQCWNLSGKQELQVGADSDGKGVSSTEFSLKSR